MVECSPSPTGSGERAKGGFPQGSPDLVRVCLRGGLSTGFFFGGRPLGGLGLVQAVDVGLAFHVRRQTEGMV